MSRDSAGTYTLPAGTATAANATPILPSQHNPGFNDVATELTNSLDRLGRGAMQANIAMGGFKVTGLANGSAATDSAAFGQIATATAAINVGQGGFGAQATVASAATVDLGATASHNLSITGVVAITAFGSSASASFPVYMLTFTGILTLTHNATSLICLSGASIVTAAGDKCRMAYLGSGNWAMIDYARLSGLPLVAPAVAAAIMLASATGVVAFNNAGTPNTKIDVSADALMMVTTAFAPTIRTGFAVTVDTATVGANGLDAGALAASTWYYLWAIDNGTAAAGLLSLSATAPTMPSGYTAKVYLGAWRTTAGSILIGLRTNGAQSQYTINPYPLMANGNVGVTAVAVAAFVPPGASQIRVQMNHTAGGTQSCQVGPNSTNFPLYHSDTTAITPGTEMGDLVLESANIYYSNSMTTFSLSCVGWTNKSNVS